MKTKGGALLKINRGHKPSLTLRVHLCSISPNGYLANVHSKVTVHLPYFSRSLSSNDPFPFPLFFGELSDIESDISIDLHHLMTFKSNIISRGLLYGHDKNNSS